MDYNIQLETIEVLSEYGQVSIAFEVKSRFRVEHVADGLGGIRLVEETVKSPYIKDYDQPDGPERWTRRSWDLSNWIVLAAGRIPGERANRRGDHRILRRWLELLRRA